MFLMALRGSIYTIAVYFYAFRPAFSGILHCILHCILHQNTLRLASKRTVFSTKMHGVLYHIALHLAANSPKMGANSGLFK